MKHENIFLHVFLSSYLYIKESINSSILVQIALNIYGCNRDKNEWESPEEWKPERFLWTRRNVIQRIFTRPWRLELERGPAMVLFRQC